MDPQLLKELALKAPYPPPADFYRKKIRTAIQQGDGSHRAEMVDEPVAEWSARWAVSWAVAIYSNLGAALR